ncbi:uncharacterized protein METZ01_LOCUS459078, partial [marine metagenome]
TRRTTNGLTREPLRLLAIPRRGKTVFSGQTARPRPRTSSGFTNAIVIRNTSRS